MNYLDRSNRKLNAIEARIRLLIKRAQRFDLDEMRNTLVTRLAQQRWRITDFLRNLVANDAISREDAQRLLNYITQRSYGTDLINREVIDVIINFVRNQPRDRQWAFIDGMEKLMSNLIGMPQDEQENVLETVRQGIAPNQTYQQSPLYRPDLPQVRERLTMIPLSPKQWLFLSQDRYAAWIGIPNKPLRPIDHQYVLNLLKQRPNLMEQARKNIMFTYGSPYHPVYFFLDQDTGKSFSLPSEKQIRQYIHGDTSQQPTQQNTQPSASGPTQLPIPGQTRQNTQPSAYGPTQLPIPGQTQQRPNAGKRSAPSY